MKSRNLAAGILAAGLIFGVHLAIFAQQTTPPAAPAADAPQAGSGAVDPRVQQRTYAFADTNEQMPYALFVSSKVTRDKKNPLIIPNAAANPNAASIYLMGHSMEGAGSHPGGHTVQSCRAAMPDIYASFAKHSKPAAR